MMRKMKEPKKLNSFQWVMRELSNPDWETKLEFEPLTMREKNELIGFILTGQPSSEPKIMTKENVEEAHKFVMSRIREFAKNEPNEKENKK